MKQIHDKVTPVLLKATKLLELAERLLQILKNLLEDDSSNAIQRKAMSVSVVAIDFEVEKAINEMYLAFFKVKASTCKEIELFNQIEELNEKEMKIHEEAARLKINYTIY